MTSFAALLGRGVAVGLGCRSGATLGRGAAACSLQAASRKANASTRTRLVRTFIATDTTPAGARFPRLGRGGLGLPAAGDGHRGRSDAEEAREEDDKPSEDGHEPDEKQDDQPHEKREHDM